PPRSTRFPYTTLFRSDGSGQGADEHGGRKRQSYPVPLPGDGLHEPCLPELMAPPCWAASPQLGPARTYRQFRNQLGKIQHACCRDRKSTRLNSSHLVI